MPIRPATSADLPQLAEFLRRQATQQQAENPVFDLLPTADYAGLLRQRANDCDAAILVDQCDGHIVGYISIRVVDETRRARQDSLLVRLGNLLRPRRKHTAGLFAPRRYGFIEDWYVVPDRRGQGIGKTLWLAACDWFRRRQVRQIDATVWANNQLGQAAFRKLGFEPVRLLLNRRLE
jgi:ribosomal protein S18 acetylase RimI-like enzyme